MRLGKERSGYQIAESTVRQYVRERRSIARRRLSRERMAGASQAMPPCTDRARVACGAGDAGARRAEGVRGPLRAAVSTGGKSAQRDVAGRSHATGPAGCSTNAVGRREPWLTVILDDYSRAVAGYALSLHAPVEHPDGAGAAAGDLAQRRPALVGVRHPRDVLYRPWQRLHLASPRAGRG